MATHDAVTRMSTPGLMRHLVDNMSNLVNREVEMVNES